MSTDVSDGNLLGAREPNRLLGAFIISYLIAGTIYGLLIWAGSVWNQLANTRLLDLLFRGGIVQLTDADYGFIAGAPDTDLLVASRDPVDWLLILLAMGVFGLFWAIKSIQFHRLAEFVGIEGKAGEHARAYLYGLGLNRFLPFNVGNVGAASALVGQGATPEKAAQTVFLADLMVALEIAIFAGIGLFLVGFATWAGMLFYPVLILVVAYLVLYGRRRHRGEVEVGAWTYARTSLRALAARPAEFTKLLLLSVIAFALEDIAAFMIAMAFTSHNVILHVETDVLLMAVVGSYIARYIALTPGGIGQFEWGFAAVLYIGGLGMPEAVTIAILDNVVRYVAGTFVWGGLLLGYGVDTDTRSVLERFRTGSLTTPEVAA